MPPFDNVSRSKLISENNDNYSRLLAVFSDGAARIDNRVAVVFKNDKQFESAARSAQSSTYQRMAGTDLSNIFMPFYVTPPTGVTMPTFEGDLTDKEGITAGSLLPFKYTASEEETDIITTPTDSYKNVLSGDSYKSPASSRIEKTMRGVGVRLPMMGVGWGYDTEGNPFPAGETAGKFIGEVDEGWEVDPKNYVAAPIDIRFDASRGVWTAAGSSVIKMKVFEEYEDYLNCRAWDDETASPFIKVAKPPELRHVLENYPQLLSLDTQDVNEVEVTGNVGISVVTENWKITPSYRVGREIFCTTAETDVLVDEIPITLLDINIAARAWAIEVSQ